MDRPARGGRNRRGGRGFGRPGPSGAAAGWASSAETTTSTPDLDLDSANGDRGTRGGRGFGGRRGAGSQTQGGGGGGGLNRLVWRPKGSQTPPTPGSSDEGDPASCAATLDNDDLLGQILLRLPPLPSSLPRAAGVCRRWRGLVADPGFLARFRAHHEKPPLLGFFFYNRGKIGFTSVLDPPDPIPAADRFNIRLPRGSKVHGCRHGRLLMAYGNSFLVWDPVTGEHYHLPFPSASGGTKYALDATIVCAASAIDPAHVHGSCHSSPYRVVFLGSFGEQIITYVYSSDTHTWGDAISMTGLDPFDPNQFLSCSNTLVGNSIYWLLNERALSILEFDLDRQSLAAIELPQDLIHIDPFEREEWEFLIMPAEEGCGIGLLIIAGFSARIWKRKCSCDGNAGWVLINTVKLDNHLRLKPWAHAFPPVILGFDEDHNVMFLLTAGRVFFMVHLDSWQFKKLPYKKMYRLCYPFTSFCTAGLGPLSPVTSVPQVMSAMDSWPPFEAITDEPNSLAEVGVADCWDPMVLEASINATSVQTDCWDPMVLEASISATSVQNQGS